MSGFSPHHGEGAVSTGLMVPLHDAKTVVEARAVVDLLEQNQIPALVNLEVEGILFPWRDPPQNSSARVLVPSKMLQNARDVLRRAGRDVSRGQPGVRLVASDAQPARAEARRSLRTLVLPTTFEADDEEDTGPLDFELPEAGRLTQRIVIALLGIAFGTALQRIMELFLGAENARAELAARAPVMSEPWRLVTASFIHSGPEHFFANAVFGIVIGVVIFGTHEIGATLLVWLLASMVGLVAEISLLPAGVLVLGASAGNYGLVGLWARGQLERAQRSLLPRREVIRTIGILLLLVPGALTPVTSSGTKVAVIAHLGGFLAGFLLGFVFRRRLAEDELPRIERRSRLALILGVALVTSSLAAAVLSLFA